jgi:apolipoprotein N-acyltransferase
MPIVERIQKSATRIWPAVLTATIYVLIFPLAALSPLAFFFLLPVLFALNAPDVSFKRVFWLFWWVGFLGNIGKQYWLVYTMNHYGFIPMPLAILVFLLMSGTLGFFWAFMGLGAYRLRRSTGLPLLVLLPASFVMMEWCLTWVLSGFPWELLGNSLVNMLPLAQAADIFGVYGLSFFVVVGNIALFSIARRFWQKRKDPQSAPACPKAAVATFAIMFAVILVYGLIRLPMIERELAKGKTIRVGLLQGNIDQLVKWKQSKEETTKVYYDLAQKTVDEGAELIIMPETSLPYWQWKHKKLNKNIREFATRFDRYALVAYPMKARPINPGAERKTNKHNVATLLDPKGKQLGTAFKHKLVPFGEYLPFPDQVLWLKNTLKLEKARLTKGFSASDQYTPIEYPPGGRFGVAICYEVIFPAMVRKIANLGTDFMVTITNDSWFGDTSAPHQHVDMVAMRAIENRRSFARAANTGISCVVDATGQVRGQTKTYVRAHLTEDIQTISIRSIYSRIGDLFILIAGIFLAGCTAWGVWKRKKGAKHV